MDRYWQSIFNASKIRTGQRKGAFREAIITGNENRSRISVLHVTPELAPISKVGGLADVAGSLPAALRKLGADARVITPAWPGVKKRLKEMGADLEPVHDTICVPLQWRAWCGFLSKTELGGVPVFLLEHPDLFENPDIYPDVLDSRSSLPFAFLSLAALELVYSGDWKPSLVHAHDWPTSIVTAALKWHRYYGMITEKPLSVLTIHNMAHQGSLPLSVLDEWGMAGEAFGMDAMEFFGGANLLKGGITSADSLTTVSPGYAKEILTSRSGEGLETVLEYRRERIRGIVNGIDTDYWDPRTDKMIPANFHPGAMKGKKACKIALSEECGWNEHSDPILVSVGRLVRQKGMDIILRGLDTVLAMGARFVAIGTGEQEFEKAFAEIADRRPGSVYFRKAFDERFAHLAYAGGDILLMPSLFEPCGLSQMISMRYGTVPVVRSVGGLGDTVADVDAGPHGTGFMFEDYSGDALVGSVRRAMEHFVSPRRWSMIRKRCMEKDFSWSRSAQAYMSLYGSLIQSGPSSERGGSE